MRRSLITLAGLALWACDVDTPGAAEAGVGACVTADLIAQCPAGSNPLVGVQAAEACSGEAALVEDGSGQVVAQCYGVGSCRVLCQFAVPCRCGVAEVTHEGVICASCQGAASCGNQICEGGEDPERCPIDCGAECQPDERRCDGADHYQECDLRGRWARVRCPTGEVCVAEGAAAWCEHDLDVIRADAGVDAGGNPPPPPLEGRVVPGEGALPERVDLRRGEAHARFGRVDWDTRNTIGDVHNTATEFANITATAGVQLWRIIPGEDLLEGIGASGRVKMDFEGNMIRREDLPEVAPSMEEVCGAWEPCGGYPLMECEIYYDAWLEAFGPIYLECFRDQAAEGCDLYAQSACRWSHYISPPFTEHEEAEIILRGADGQHNGRYAVGIRTQERFGVLDLNQGAWFTHAPIGEFRFDDARALSADGRLAAARAYHGADEIIALLDVDAGEIRPILPSSASTTYALSLSPGGRVLARSMRGGGELGVDNALSIWDVATERRIFSILPLDPDDDRHTIGVGMPEARVAFSPDGRTLAAVIVPQQAVEIWDLPDRAKRQTLEHDPGNRVTRMAWAPNGINLAVMHQHPAVINVWNVETGQRVATLEGFSSGLTVHQMSYDEGGDRLLVWISGYGSNFFTVVSWGP